MAWGWEVVVGGGWVGEEGVDLGVVAGGEACLVDVGCFGVPEAVACGGVAAALGAGAPVAGEFVGGGVDEDVVGDGVVV